jgi:hypothetical protein
VWRGGEAALAVAGEDVLDDRAGFGEHEVAVGDNRCGADRMQRLEGGGREDGDGIAVVDLEVVGEFELLAQPEDPFGLGFAEMVDGEHQVVLGEGKAEGRHVLS